MEREFKLMIKNGVKNFIEIGPGKALSGMVKRTKKDLKFLFNLTQF